MDASASQSWSHPEPLGPMAHMTEDLDDLGSFLDFGEIDLDNLPDLEATQYGDHMQQAQHIPHPNTPFDGMSQVAPPLGTLAQDFGGQDQFGMSQNVDGHQQEYNRQATARHPFMTDSIYQPEMRQQYHQNSLQSQPYGFPPGNQVPPTPNSFDMHGEAGHFMGQHHADTQQRAMLEQQYALRKNDAIAYTPMVTPADTPQYNPLPEFTIPGVYFSPLTSPMLYAENAQNGQQHHGYYTDPSTAPSSNATSPIYTNVDVDMLSDGMLLPESATAQPKKLRRKVATPRSTATSARVRQSPIQKPQKRKPGTLSQVMTSSEDAVNGARRSNTLQMNSAGLQMPAAFNASSDDESISPEPLSEALMGPPPRPCSSPSQSPALSAQQQGPRTAASGPTATPKSLLSRDANQLPINTPVASGPASADFDSLEDLQLPEAASNRVARPSLAQLETHIPSAGSNDQTPRLSARKTPKLGPLSTPSSARPTSALASPSVAGSPMTASTPGALLHEKRSDSKCSKGNKKRGSVGANASTMASPAIMPRISPSIKPLLPDGSALHSPTHALLLASKSNYQNLLEGNHLPGVSYPDSLSSGLTTKRTSHKVAEQGRRNRINDALKEMQALLPKQPKSKGGKDNSNSDDSPDVGQGEANTKESREEALAKSNSSKASTVESANVYIKVMQENHRRQGAELERVRRENEELLKRLAEQATTPACADKAVEAIDSASPASVKAQ